MSAVCINFVVNNNVTNLRIIWVELTLVPHSMSLKNFQRVFQLMLNIFVEYEVT
jgi:hypothetical protein